MERKTLWRTTPTLASLNALNAGTLGEATGMQFVEIGDDYLVLEMPVDRRTVQPYGLLHGGASAALAETVGSVASALASDPTRERAVGIELNCSHLRGVREGVVQGTCRAVRVGRRLHVWEIDIRDGDRRRVCLARLTVAIVVR